MNKVFDENTRAIIIAIENYRFDKISKVRYAINDAEKFKATLIDFLGIKKENIKTFYDSDASKTALEDDIKYEIRQLNDKERFIFYYVGHGFYEGSSNRISAYDTSPMNYSDTTISLKEMLIEPLERSECKRSLIFLDTCSQIIAEYSKSRDSISNIHQEEFDNLLRQSEYCATFLSCSPGEKSYSDDNLKNGIWTYHLTHALSGKAEKAITSRNYITDTSLRDYLRLSVPDFIVKNTDIRGTQTPIANIKASNSFLIYEVPSIPKEDKINSQFPRLPLVKSDPKIYNREFKHVENAHGFENTHFPPTSFSKPGEKFIQKVFKEDVEEEIQIIYQKTKDVFNLRRKNIIKEIGLEKATIHNNFFEYELRVTQSESYPSHALFSRNIILVDDESNTLSYIDDVFPYKFNQIFFECKLKSASYDDIVEQFENLADRENGRLEEDDRILELNYHTIDGLLFKLNLKKEKAFLYTNRDYRLMDFIKKAESFINQISNTEHKLVTKTRKKMHDDHKD